MNLSLIAVASAEHGAPDVMRLLLALAVLLLAARALGELARYFGQPTVLGELSAGVLLGASSFGRIAPEWSAWLFPTTGTPALVLDGLGTLSVTLFLLVAGLEVDLSRISKRGKAALAVGAFGIAVPFAVGWVAAKAIPELVGYEASRGHPLGVFALFLATALSISALPVIAKVLMDLRLYKTDFGMIVIGSAILNDLAGWVVFAVILGMIQSADVAPSVWGIALSAIGFAVLVLTLGRWIVHRALPWVQAHTAWPGGVIVFSISFALVSAAITDWIGIHAIFGAFLAGIALGDSTHLREKTRTTVGDFVSSFFAPLFFALLGLRIDFVTHFDWVVVSVVFAIACAGKIVGCGIGARWTGMSTSESLAIGFAMNARGSMGIILGLTAYQNGLIGERLLVALVFMALVTSMISGPAIERALGRRKPARFARALSGKRFVRELPARDETAVLRELSALTAASSGLDAARIEAAVRERGRIHAFDGVAVLCGRIDSIEWPIAAFGMSHAGVAVSSGRTASLVFLVLTPQHKPELEPEILSDVESTLADESLRARILAVQSYTELLALLRAEAAAR